MTYGYTTVTTIDQAAKALLSGNVVGMPTETVYGLAACAHLPDAVRKIYALKSRPSHNPLIVHVPSPDEMEKIAYVQRDLLRRLSAFMPGPLTLVAPLRPEAKIASEATGGLSTVALRVPAHSMAQKLLQAVGRPLVAPSANLSGFVSPTTAEHVKESFPDLMVIEGGACEKGLESTIVDISQDPFRILRPGTVTYDALECALGVPLSVGQGDMGSSVLKAPGMMLKHYAPKMPLRLQVTTPQPGETYIGFGAMGSDRAAYNLSETSSLEEAAARLFSIVRAADAKGHPIAVAPIPQEGVGVAINDRLMRASAKEKE